LEELGMEIVRKIESLPTEPSALNALLNELQAAGVEAIVTVALPPHLLAQLSSRFPLYIFEMRSVLFQTREEAERWVAEEPEKRTYLLGRSSNEPVRGLEFLRVNRVKIVVESEPVWPRPAGQ
jgi:hypothetical protein